MAKKQTKGALEAQDKTPETTATPETTTEAKPAKRNRASKAKAEAEGEVDAAKTIDPDPVVEPGPAPKKAKRTKHDATLEDAFASYLAEMERDGKSPGTLASYRAELVIAGDELGLQTRLADLKPEAVLIYFTCDRVMKLRSGRPKSQLSIDKSRRVLRLCLVHAEAAKLVAKAPVPELAASH